MIEHAVDQSGPALHRGRTWIGGTGRLAEAGQVDGKAAVGALERLELVVPHGRLQRESMEEDDGVAGAAIGHVDRLT